MVAPEREPLKREVEVDQFFLGGVEEGTHGARLHTDGWRGHLPLRKAGHLPRAHRAISNRYPARTTSAFNSRTPTRFAVPASGCSRPA